MGISKSTFYRYISDLLKDGTVKQEKEGYSLNTELFPICFSKKIINAFKSQLDDIRQSMGDEEFSKSAVYPQYKTFYYYYNMGFQGLMIPPEEFVMKLSAGFVTRKKRRNEPVEKPVLDYWEYTLK